MVSTSGSQLLPPAAVRNLRLRLLPLTTVLTPNIPEAQLLLKDEDNSNKDKLAMQGVTDIVDLAQKVQRLGPRYVLVKGGHVPLTKDLVAAKSPSERHIVANVFCSADEVVVFKMQYQSSQNTHGTGCSLACK